MEPSPGQRPKRAASSCGDGPASLRRARVAFFGGSFDPPHLGHLAVARAARQALHLDRVLFAPVGAQPLKPRGSTASFPDRVAMTELAIAGEPGFEISLADAPTTDNQPNYTLETLRSLRAGLSEGSLFCLMGADSFVSLRRWHGAADIPFVASLVVASRPGQQLDDLARFLPRGLTFDPAQEDPAAENEPSQPATGVPLTSSPRDTLELRSYVLRNAAGHCAPFYLLPGLDVEISASKIRTQIRTQIRSSHQNPAAINTLLPAPVAEYIRAHGLYR